MLIKIQSALVSGIYMAILGVGGYVIGIGDVFALDLHVLINVATISAVTAIVSLLKSGTTSDKGTVAGIQVK